MQPVLSPAACHFLRQLQPKVAAQGRVKKATTQKAVQEVLGWCLAQQLPGVSGNSLHLPAFYFDQQLLKQIVQVQKQLAQPDFRTDYTALQRTEAALTSNIEQKSIGIKPRDQRVLIRLVQAEPLVHGLLAQVLDIDWQSLSLESFDALLVVENLDCFYQLERFTFDVPYQQPLIIYRGDKLYGKGVKALKQQWLNNGKPTLYFGDFDTKGVSIALTEGYSAMLLPDFTTLQQHARPAMLPDGQISYLNSIAHKAVSGAFQPYQQLLTKQLSGLRQQNMQGQLLSPVLL